MSAAQPADAPNERPGLSFAGVFAATFCGLVGVGSNNSRGQFDNVTVQDLPPQTSFENTEDFTDGVADLFTG